MRTLKVKCPTWHHVETFYARKLRSDNTLTIRVPFNPQEGSIVTIGLQLPNGTVLAIEGKVLGVMAAPPGKNAAIRLHLFGMTTDVMARLKSMVASAGAGDSAAATNVTMAAPPPVGPTAKAPAPEAPVPLPEDAPIDEEVTTPPEPEADQVTDAGERAVFDQLHAELDQLREFAAYEVLGVDPEADVASIRRTYLARSKHFHPDLFARYRSQAIMHIAQEVFIHINRAYDRMRQNAVAAGRAVVAGPALLPHEGWLAGLDDMAAAVEPPASAAEDRSALANKRTPRPLNLINATVEQLIIAGDYEGARAYVADALHADPRNRPLRALYYVVGAKEALAGGDTMLAASQFEAALAHDHDCRDAREALDELRAGGKPGGPGPRTLR